MMSKLGAVLVIFLVLSSMEALHLDADGLAGVTTKQKVDKKSVAENSILALALRGEEDIGLCESSTCASDEECHPDKCGRCGLCTSQSPKCWHCECAQTNPGCDHK
uniref:Conotoxin n=1 Tax=Conus betulinus TaxID=89764 RepID=A0A142C1H8_CONBE|nr:conotoxin [Conus betulinus]